MILDLRKPSQAGRWSTPSNKEKHDEIQQEVEQEDSTTSQVRLELPSLAEACDRIGVSNRLAAITINSAIRDMGILTKEKITSLINRSRIRRAREEVCKDIQRKSSEGQV
ncbi:hypothetical protein ILUMI_17006, partial [Ignelater luminosus]